MFCLLFPRVLAVGGGTDCFFLIEEVDAFGVHGIVVVAGVIVPAGKF